MAQAVYTDPHRSVNIEIDERHTEAFGALRTASFYPTTGWTFAYNINAGLVHTDTDGVTGAVNHSGVFAELSTGTAADGYAQIQTRRGSRYIPGVGALCRFTHIFDTGVADSIQIIGIIDDDNGWAFGYDGETFGILRRSSGVDTWIPQAEWNIDTRLDLDPTKGNVYQIQFQWLGFGPQTFFIENQAGQLKAVHSIDFSNFSTVTSVGNPNLPITARVENLGNTTDIVAKTPSAIAGLDGDPYNGSIATIIATDVVNGDVSAGTNIPIITLRNPSTWLGVNNHLFVQALRIAFATELTQTALFRVFANSTITGGTYSDIQPNVSPIQENTTFTGRTGGVQIGSFPLGKTGQAIVDVTGSEFNGYPGEEITIVLDTTGLGDVTAGVTFRQFL